MNDPMPHVPQLYSVAQVAEHLNLCTKTVLSLIRKKTLPAHQIGKQYRVAKSDLAAYLVKVKT